MNRSPFEILIVDDEANIRKTLTRCLELDDYHVTSVGNGKDALEAASRHAFDLVFLDIRLGVTRGTDLIQPLLASSPWMKIVMMTAYASVDTAVDSMKKGAVDYLSKPFTPEQVREVAARVAEAKRMQQQAVEPREKSNAGEPDFSDLTGGRSAALQKAVMMARQVAPTETPVLLRGESGSGKGLLARAIHAWRKNLDGTPPKGRGAVYLHLALGDSTGNGSGNLGEETGKHLMPNAATVILVEDEPQIRRFVHAALEAEGCRVFEADTAKRGLTEAGTRQPDLIILDLGLPDLDGIEFLRDLRNWSQVPVNCWHA